jgi:hypothetical protein
MSSRELKFDVTEKEAPYAPKEELGIYKVRRWSFREKQDATMRASKILDADKGLVEMNVIDFQMEQILVCVTPPEGFELTRERVETIDPDVGDILLDACRKVNATTTAERKGFLEPSAAEKVTPG